MKLYLVAVGFAALVAAQADSTGYFPGEPSCAIPCLTSAITAAGCQLSDLGCQCGPTQTAIAARVGGCLIGACSGNDLGQAISAGQAVCSSFNAGQLSFTTPSGPVQTPTPVTSSSGSSSESGSGTTSVTETETSIIMTLPPTQNATVTTTTATTGTKTTSQTDTASTTETDSESTTSGATDTDTLGITSPTLTETFTSTTEPTTSPSGAAATPAKLGVGALAGLMGALAFL